MTRRVLATAALLLAVFALYAPAVRLMPWNDDATQVAELVGITPLTIFENRHAPYSLVFGHYRPMGYLPWVLIGDGFGWYLPSMLHALNVWVHVIATALAAALAWRMARLFRLPAGTVSIVAAAMFGSLPLAYSAVLWAAAVVHAQATLFGLAAAWAYLALPGRGRRRWLGLAGVAALLAMACLSHEMGPVFGAFVLWAEIARATATRSRLRWSGFALFGLAAAWFLFYRLFLQTDWTSSRSLLLEGGLAEMPAKLAYHLQNLAIWPAAALRPLLPISEADSVALLFGLAAAVVGGGLLVLRAAGLARAGLVALGFWAIGIAPSLLLSQRYLLDGPRLLYPSTFGGALWWALLTAAGWKLARRPAARAAIAAAWCAALAWSASYVAARLNEAARLTPAMRLLDADLRRSSPSDRLLFINTPLVNLARQPAFFLGREGLPIWMPYYADASMAPQWPASLSGITRATSTVLHEASLTDRETAFRAPDYVFTRGGDFRYAVFGQPVDDAGLRSRMLGSTFIYRFDYDVPGFRMARLGEVRPGQADGPALASFTRGAAQVSLADARAGRCGDRIALRLTWAGARAFTESAAVFVHVLDAQGAQAAVADRDLLGGALPLDQAPPQTVITETRWIDSQPPAAAHAIAVGVYSRADGARYAAARGDGQAWPDAQVVVPVGSDVEWCAP